MLLRVLFPADALGNRARGLERELKASMRHRKKYGNSFLSEKHGRNSRPGERQKINMRGPSSDA